MSRASARITCPAQQRPEASFPSLRRLLSVASGGQTRCCQPSFARWHIGSDPFPPLVSLPLPPRSAPLLSVRFAGATGGLTLLCQNWQQRV